MVFSLVIFLFLPLLLLAYLVSPKPLRNLILLLSSLFFNAWGEGFYVALMLGSIAMNYGFGRWLDHTRGHRGACAALVVAVGWNLALHAWFKYAHYRWSYHFDRELVESERPDIVIEERSGHSFLLTKP